MFHSSTQFMLLISTLAATAVAQDLCAVVAFPKNDPNCCWKPQYDSRLCTIGYQCKDVAECLEATDPVTTPKPCALLNPYENSVPHPLSDPKCLQGKPGWSPEIKSLKCRCVFVAKEYEGDCVTQYYSYCVPERQLIIDNKLELPVDLKSNRH